MVILTIHSLMRTNLNVLTYTTWEEESQTDVVSSPGFISWKMLGTLLFVSVFIKNFHFFCMCIYLKCTMSTQNPSLITSKGHAKSRAEFQSRSASISPLSLNNGPVRAGLQALMRMFGIKQCFSTLLTFLCGYHWGTVQVRRQSHELFSTESVDNTCHRVTLVLIFPHADSNITLHVQK